MKLAYSPASPYVRKVNACAIARGIDGKIERWKVGTTDPALLEFNPLSKVPTLITVAGAGSITRRSPYIARVSFTLWQHAVPLAEWAAKNGIRELAIAYSDYAAGTDTRERNPTAALGESAQTQTRPPIGGRAHGLVATWLSCRRPVRRTGLQFRSAAGNHAHKARQVGDLSRSARQACSRAA